MDPARPFVDPDAETQPPSDSETQEPSCYEVFATFGQRIEGDSDSEEGYIILSSSPSTEPASPEQLSLEPPVTQSVEPQEAEAPASPENSEFTSTDFSEGPPLQNIGVTQFPFTIPEITTQQLGLQHELTFSSRTQTQQRLSEEIESSGVTQFPFTVPEVTTQQLGLQHELTFTSQIQQRLSEEIESSGVTQFPFTVPEVTTQQLGLQHELTFTSQIQRTLSEETEVPQSPEPERKKLRTLSTDLCRSTQTFISGEIKHFHVYTETDLVEDIVGELENTKSCQTISSGQIEHLTG